MSDASVIARGEAPAGDAEHDADKHQRHGDGLTPVNVRWVDFLRLDLVRVKQIPNQIPLGQVVEVSGPQQDEMHGLDTLEPPRRRPFARS